MKHWACILIFFFYTIAIGQNVSKDSLDEAIKNAKDDGSKAELLLSRCKKTIPSDFKLAFADAQEALSIYQKNNNEKGQVDAYNLISAIYTKENKTDLALKIDSTSLSLAKKIDYGKGQVTSYNNLGRNTEQSGNLLLAQKLYLQALDICKKNKMDNEIGESMNRLGVLCRKLGDYTSSLKYFDGSIEIFRKNNIKASLATVLMNKANTLTAGASYEEAASLHLESLRIKDELKDIRGLQQGYTNLAVVYFRINQYQEALSYHKKSILLAKQLKLPQSVALGYNNLGIVMASQKEYDSAKIYFKAALPLFQQANDVVGTGMLHNNLGNLYADMALYDSAETELISSLNIRKKIASPNDIASTLNNLGRVCSKLKKYKEAEQYLLQSLKLVSPDNALLNQYIHHNLGEHYKATGDLEEAYKHIASYASIKDTLMSEGEAINMLRAQGDYEIEKRDNQLLLAQKEKQLQDLEIKEQQLRSWSLIGLLVLSSAILILLYFLYSRKKKTANILTEKNNKIQVLIRELHHRVKNNLQVISSVLGVQAFRLTDEEGRVAVMESQRRVEAMALIHQDLYLEDEVNAINLETYMERLAQAVASSFGYGTDAIWYTYKWTTQH